MFNERLTQQQAATPQHFLYFLPLPHGHGSFWPKDGGQAAD